MTIDDFYTKLSRHARVFVEQYKRLHRERPDEFPLDQPEFSDWDEQFCLFSDTFEE
jgi:hypothetical protein